MYNNPKIKNICDSVILRQKFLCHLKSQRIVLDLVDRLQIETTLKVHNGCVNSLSWNSSGTLIISGSDDQHLVLTNPFSRKVVKTIKTGHRSNIFSAKFLPNTNDNEIISSSANGMIFYNKLEESDSVINTGFHCHSLPVYEVEPLPNENKTFLSCSEDGTLRRYDMRLNSFCNCTGCEINVILKSDRPFTALNVNQNNPFQIAVGSTDSCVRLYDLRNIENEYAKFKPPSINSKHRITSVNFNSSGTQLLASYCGDRLYLIDLTTKEDFKDSYIKRYFEKRNSDLSNDKNQFSVRLRGDWSDTGPTAMPRQRDQPAEGERGDVLLRRMTDMFTSWYGRRRNRNDSSNESSNNPVRDPEPEIVVANPINLESNLSNTRENAILERSNGNNRSNYDTITNSSQDKIIEGANNSHFNEIDKEFENLFRPKLIQFYSGHRNSRTMIKQANFWGENHVISGSDCGHVFIWNKNTCKVENVIEADKRVVNCVQPHPFGPVLAASGIDYSIKIIMPTAVEKLLNENIINDLIKRNAKLLAESRDTITIPALFMLRVLRPYFQSRERNDHNHGGNDNSEANSDV